MITDEELELARQRGEEMRRNVPHAVEAVYVPSIRRVLVLLSDGLELTLRQNDFRFMREASAEDLSTIELNAGGFEIYFPKIDEGFWIPDLLQHLLSVRRFLGVVVEQERIDFGLPHAVEAA